MSVFTVKLITLIATMLLAAFNIYLTFDNNPSNSFSEIARSTSRTMPILPWIYGFIGGHWFHPGLVPALGFWTGFLVILLITITIQIVASQLYPQGISYQTMTTTFIAGIAAGMVLWPT